MARGSWNKQSHVVPGAHQAMDNFKYEIASEMGLPVKQGSEDYWGNLSSRDCGAVGGHMVRRMIELAEQQISGGTMPTGGGTTGSMTATTGAGTQPQSSLARGTTYNSNRDKTTGATGNAGTTGTESSQAKGTTYNSNRK